MLLSAVTGLFGSLFLGVGFATSFVILGMASVATLIFRAFLLVVSSVYRALSLVVQSIVSLFMVICSYVDYYHKKNGNNFAFFVAMTTNTIALFFMMSCFSFLIVSFAAFLLFGAASPVFVELMANAALMLFCGASCHMVAVAVTVLTHICYGMVSSLLLVIVKNKGRKAALCLDQIAEEHCEEAARLSEKDKKHEGSQSSEGMKGDDNNCKGSSESSVVDGFTGRNENDGVRHNSQSVPTVTAVPASPAIAGDCAVVSSSSVTSSGLSGHASFSSGNSVSASGIYPDLQNISIPASYRQSPQPNMRYSVRTALPVDSSCSNTAGVSPPIYSFAPMTMFPAASCGNVDGSHDWYSCNYWSGRLSEGSYYQDPQALPFCGMSCQPRQYNATCHHYQQHFMHGSQYPFVCRYPSTYVECCNINDSGFMCPMPQVPGFSAPHSLVTPTAPPALIADALPVGTMMMTEETASVDIVVDNPPPAYAP